jgi:geranylgeranyl diphosphate synthase, type I
MAKASNDLEVFKNTYSKYFETISTDVDLYIKDVHKLAHSSGNRAIELEADAFLDLLGRGGRRIRAVLVYAGYALVSGEDPTKVRAVVEAGRVVEMLQTHLLIIDDIFDRSDFRRGHPSAHKRIASGLKKHTSSRDLEHIGESIAVNAALSGLESAIMIVSNLPDVTPEARLSIMSMIGRTMRITNQGQSYEMLNDLTDSFNDKSIDMVIDMKTANYTVLNPLHIGMVLAGADCQSTDAITDYAINVGRIYQLMNDIEGLFSDTKDTGKNPKDDVSEAKKTHLMSYALKNANSPDREFLRKKFGSSDISDKDLDKIRRVLVRSGAFDYVVDKARVYRASALRSLESEGWRWGISSVSFLKGLVDRLWVDAKDLKARFN